MTMIARHYRVEESNGQPSTCLFTLPAMSVALLSAIAVVKAPEEEQKIHLPADQSKQIIALADQLAYWLKDEATSSEALTLFAQCRARALEQHEADLVQWAAERAKEEAEEAEREAERAAKWEAEAPLRKARRAKQDEERKPEQKNLKKIAR
jgi:hypothetical protein